MDIFAGRNKNATLAISAEFHILEAKYNSRLFIIVDSHLSRHRPDLDTAMGREVRAYELHALFTPSQYSPRDLRRIIRKNLLSIRFRRFWHGVFLHPVNF